MEQLKEYESDIKMKEFVSRFFLELVGIFSLEALGIELAIDMKDVDELYVEFRRNIIDYIEKNEIWKFYSDYNKAVCDFKPDDSEFFADWDKHLQNLIAFSHEYFSKAKEAVNRKQLIDIEKRESYIQQLEKKLDEFNRIFEAEKKNYKFDIDKLNKDIGKLSKEIVEKEDELELLKKEFININNEKKEKDEKIKILEKSNKSYSTRVKNVNGENKELKSENEELKTKIDQLGNEKCKLTADIGRVQRYFDEGYFSLKEVEDRFKDKLKIVMDVSYEQFNPNSFFTLPGSIEEQIFECILREKKKVLGKETSMSDTIKYVKEYFNLVCLYYYSKQHPNVKGFFEEQYIFIQDALEEHGIYYECDDNLEYEIHKSSNTGKERLEKIKKSTRFKVQSSLFKKLFNLPDIIDE